MHKTVPAASAVVLVMKGILIFMSAGFPVHGVQSAWPLQPMDLNCGSKLILQPCTTFALVPCCLKPAVVGPRRKDLKMRLKTNLLRILGVKAGEEVLERIATSQKYTLWPDEAKAAFAPQEVVWLKNLYLIHVRSKFVNHGSCQMISTTKKH